MRLMNDSSDCGAEKAYSTAQLAEDHVIRVVGMKPENGVCIYTSQSKKSPQAILL